MGIKDDILLESIADLLSVSKDTVILAMEDALLQGVWVRLFLVAVIGHTANNAANEDGANSSVVLRCVLIRLCYRLRKICAFPVQRTADPE